MTLAREAAEAVLGTALQPLLQQRLASRSTVKARQSNKPQIEYKDLEMHRIVGTGQFGMVRVVRHMPTNQAYALKVAPPAVVPVITLLGFGSCSRKALYSTGVLELPFAHACLKYSMLLLQPHKIAP